MLFNNTCLLRHLLKTMPLKCHFYQGACRMNGVKVQIFNGFSTENQQIVEYLMELSGCSKEKAESLCKKRCLEKEDIQASYAFLNNIGIMQNISKHMNVLITHPTTLENHYLIFEEIGIRKSRINLSSLERFYRLVNTSQSKLKKLGYIDEDVNVMQNCLSYAGLPDNTVHNMDEENVFVTVIHRYVLSLLLKNKLSNSWDGEFPLHRRLNYKSLRYISSSYDILSKKFEIPEHRIVNDTALLCASPSNMKAIIDGIPTLGGIETNKIVNIAPKIVFNHFSALLKINESLKKYNISPEAVVKTPRVFTLRPENVEERLQIFNSHPDLSLWSFHPQVLRMVLYQRKILKRIDELKENNLKCASIFLFQSNEESFNRKIEGLDKTGGCDAVWLLRKTLYFDTKSIRSKFRKHPHWLYVPLANMKATLDFLLEQNFTRDEIFKNLVILLYPRKTVEQELNRLASQEGIECCKQGKELRRDTILPLTLYFIEHQYHFSTEAIWTCDKSFDYESQLEFTNND